MLKLIGILLIAIAIVIMNMLDLMAAEQPTQEVRPKTETVSIVEQHYGTPKAEKHIFAKDEFRAEIVTTSDPKVIRIIQLDSLGHEVPHLQQFVIKEGNVYYADFAGRPDYSKPAGKLKD